MNRIAKLVALLVSLVLLAAGALATSTAADAATYTKMSSTESSFANTVLAELNHQRAEHGLKKLTLNSKLTDGAGGHNRTMAKANTISHQLRGERDYVKRMRAAGWKYNCASGENIGVNGDMTRTGAAQLQKLMYGEVAPNDGHKKNILNRRYTHVGISVLLDRQHNRLWLTVDLGQRRC